MSNKSKLDYTNYHKICTVRNGRGFIIVGYCFTIITFILGLCVLPEDIAFGVWLFTLLGVVSTVYFYYKKCANYVYIGQYSVIFKRIKYEWTNVYVTMCCPGPSLLKRTYENVVYFSDHYLTQEEIKTNEIRKNGFYIELNEERATILLSLYNKRVQILDHSKYDKLTTTMVENHNRQISDLSAPNV